MSRADDEQRDAAGERRDHEAPAAEAQLGRIDVHRLAPAEAGEHERAEPEQIDMGGGDGRQPPVIARALVAEQDCDTGDGQALNGGDDQSRKEPHHHQLQGQIHARLEASGRPGAANVISR